MSEDNSSNSVSEKTERKPFLQSLLGGLFQSEPKNREDLVEVIRDSADNELIDSDTKEMIEGVMQIYRWKLVSIKLSILRIHVFLFCKKKVKIRLRVFY